MENLTKRIDLAKGSVDDDSLFLRTSKADAGVIGFIINEQDSSHCELGIRLLEKFGQPVQIVYLLLGDENQLLTKFISSQSSGNCHDIEDLDLILGGKPGKVTADPFQSLACQRFGALSQYDSDINPLSKASAMAPRNVLVFPDWIFPSNIPGWDALVSMVRRRLTVC